MLDTIIGTPRQSYEQNISEVHIHIHNFEHSRVIMNMKLSSHGFLFHRHINRREAQIPLIIHHNEKNQRIYFWCAEKDNWASQISEVAFQKILISTISTIIMNFKST